MTRYYIRILSSICFTVFTIYSPVQAREPADVLVERIIKKLEGEALLAKDPRPCMDMLRKNVDRALASTSLPSDQMVDHAVNDHAAEMLADCMHDPHFTLLDTAALLRTQTKVRGEVDPSVTVEIVSGVPVLTIVRFDRKLPEELISLIASLGTNRYVIDVRNQRGGSVYTAIHATHPYARDGTTLIATLSYRDLVDPAVAGEPVIDCKKKWSSPGPTCREATYLAPGTAKGHVIAVLMNRRTASAAELYVGILRYLADARLFGTQTYGKGVSQALVETLGYGVGMKYTSTEFRPGDGTPIHGVGLTPDVHIEDTRDRGYDEQLATAIRWVQTAGGALAQNVQHDQ